MEGKKTFGENKEAMCWWRIRSRRKQKIIEELGLERGGGEIEAKEEEENRGEFLLFKHQINHYSMIVQTRRSTRIQIKNFGLI